MIPANIKKEHIDRAISEVDPSSIPPHRLSYAYFLNADGKSLPPKYVISIANIYANNQELDSEDFNAVEAVAFLKKLEYKIERPKKMENIKLYDIHGFSAISNFDTLITPDNEYFYWDHGKFLRYEKDDIVFWINRVKGIALYTRVESTNIIPSYNLGKNTIKDMKYEVSAQARDENQFRVFYRFKIIQKTNIPQDWQYEDNSTFSNQLMAYILYEPGINNPEKRISKIKDIKILFKDNEEIILKLNDAITLLGGENIVENESRDLVNSKRQNQTGEIMENILTAIKTKPFILLAGLSGTGKSRLVRTLAYKTCTDPELREDEQKPGNYELIPVRPNWHDSTELMGYVSRIAGEKYVVTDFLRFIAKAIRYPEVPFFLCLDEMNLAPVEQYFAEYLSIIETRQKKGDRITTDFLVESSDFKNSSLYDQIINDLELTEYPQCKDGIGIPGNLVVMGTVNMDETTHSFSRKVLDRAMTFEMNKVDLHSGLTSDENDWSYPQGSEDYFQFDDMIGEFTAGNEVYENFPEGKDVIGFLEELNKILEDTPFKIAYRVRDEFLIYCYYALNNGQQNGNRLQNYLDLLTSMKILSRIEGDQARTETVISGLLSKLTENDYPVSHKKLMEMKRRLQNGYTSFWS